MVGGSSGLQVQADLTTCDREPIHIPGSIQPHGLLLVADAQSHAVVAGAGALEACFGADWLGRDLGALLGQDVRALLADAPAALAGRLIVASVHGADGPLDVAIHQAGDRLLVELEPAAAAPMTAGAALAWLDASATTFERASDLQALCARAAIAFRTITGFDRVMVYRFIDDEAGRVIAEDRDPALGTFLHHHFPATDIPRQARALYVRNRARVIPTVDYVPAPLRPAGFATLDLSDVGVRSVSPIHLEYLRNMGVGASASISIVKDGVLWGLIACHNATPRLLPRDVRATAATLANSLARQIRAKEEAEAYRERLRLRAAEDIVVPAIGVDLRLDRVLLGIGDELRAMLGADGLALVHGGRTETIGTCPPDADVTAIAQWVATREPAEPFATHHLAGLYPAAERCAARASGLLAVPLRDEDILLLWFRAERIEEIEWAGNPHKAVGHDPDAVLTPRASFASWTQTVRGRSRRWSLEEVEAAYRLRRVIRDAHRNRQLRELNRELNRTIAEKDALIARKDVLMKEVDHRVQNSLQLVSAFLAVQARQAGPGAVADQLAEAQSRLSAVALVHRRLYRDDQIETIDLARYLEELARDLQTSLGAEWASRMTLDIAPVLIPTDRAVSIGLIMTELVINATKYAYGGDPGPIAIALEQYRDRLRLTVADQGIGRRSEAQGFGSRMMNAMVERLSGTLDQDDNLPGLRVVVTAPIEDRLR